MINLLPEPLAAALSQRLAAKNKHDYYNKSHPVDMVKPGPRPQHPALLECHRGFVETVPGSMWDGGRGSV